MKDHVTVKTGVMVDEHSLHLICYISIVLYFKMYIYIYILFNYKIEPHEKYYFKS